MSTFPTLTGGRSFMAPLADHRTYPVTRLRFADGSQQRFRAAPMRRRFVLTFTGIPKADADTLRTFFDSRKGSYDSFSLTINGETVTKLRFDQDELRITETTRGRYDCTLNMEQRSN